MKQRSTTQPVSKSFRTQSTLVAMSVLIAAAGVFQMSTAVFARDFDAEIRAKEKEAQHYSKQAEKLSRQADSLQNVLNTLSGQIKSVQLTIEANQKKHDKLLKEIEESKKLIEANREALGVILSDMYVEDQISPLEMLASSQSIGDYIDKQEYRAAIRSNIGEKIKEIENLKSKLEKDKEAVSKIIKDQKLKNAELDSKRGKQAELLRKTRGDESAYKKLVQNRQGEIKKLQEARRALQNRTKTYGSYISASGSGGYPYANVGYPCWDDSCVDPWRLYYRECTSYVAWRLSSTGRGVRSFGGQGHAFQWPGTTASYTSQRYGTNPRVGDAAVLGQFVGGAAWTGHVMYVEAVHSDGSIEVSEYNWHGNGIYGKRSFTPAEYSNMTFITFPKV